jgi:hypothetical protein
MCPDEFVARWAELAGVEPCSDWSLAKAPPGSLDDTSLNAETKLFLICAGLPRSAAPFLSFMEVAEGAPRIWEVYSPYDWSEEEKRPLDRYRMIGSDGGDNPLCVDEAQDCRIVMLDHEDRFRTVTFVDSSVPHLAAFLLECARDPDDAEYLGKVWPEIDEPAVRPGCFWWDEINSMRSIAVWPE